MEEMTNILPANLSAILSAFLPNHRCALHFQQEFMELKSGVIVSYTPTH